MFSTDFESDLEGWQEAGHSLSSVRYPIHNLSQAQNAKAAGSGTSLLVGNMEQACEADSGYSTPCDCESLACYNCWESVPVQT